MTSGLQPPPAPRSPYFQAKHVRRLAFYQPHHFAFTLLGWILFSMAPLVLGYLSQQIFDSLSGRGDHRFQRLDPVGAVAGR